MSYIITYGDDQQFQAIMFLLQTAQGMSAGDPCRYWAVIYIVLEGRGRPRFLL